MNVRRSAELMQGSKEDDIFTTIKDGLWTQTDDGKWKIDHLKDPFRMANHTRMFHQKPTKEEVLEAVSKQYYSGEGAIGYASTSVIRCNVDLLDDKQKQDEFHSLYLQDIKLAKDYLKFLNPSLDDKEINHRVARWRANPCYEILGKDFMCNLSEIHLNNIDPYNIQEQDEAFEAGGYITASLLHQQFDDEKFRYSREIDPIVGVSFTGLFDFFVKAFGIDWLFWWKQGRQDYAMVITEQTWNGWQDNFPQPLLDIINNFNNGARKIVKGQEYTDGLLFKELEKWYLTHWRDVASKAVTTYCVRNNLRVPNRITTVQPAGSKSLLTGASCGYHPPKATRYIRRITFAVGDPIAQACIDFGYNVTPSQSDKDENGVLLDDPFDTRCTEWLVEIPVEVPWANITDNADIDINKFSAAAQFDFFIQVQTYYSQHNVSSTIELREGEIEELASLIYTSIESNSAYVSTSLLARYDSYESFPRMPFEPITKDKYNELEQQVLDKRTTPFFYDLIKKYYVNKDFEADRGSVACEKEVCSMTAKL